MCRVTPRNKTKAVKACTISPTRSCKSSFKAKLNFSNGISCRDFYCTAAVLSPGIMRKHPLSISRLFLFLFLVFFNYRLNRKQEKDKMTKREGESGKTSRNSMPKHGAFAAKTYIVPIRLSQKQNYYHKSLMEFFNEC